MTAYLWYVAVNADHHWFKKKNGEEVEYFSTALRRKKHVFSLKVEIPSSGTSGPTKTECLKERILSAMISPSDHTCSNLFS